MSVYRVPFHTGIIKVLGLEKIINHPSQWFFVQLGRDVGVSDENKPLPALGEKLPDTGDFAAI